MEDYEKFFVGLSDDPFMASFELLQKIDGAILKRSPDEKDYSTACGLLAAFYEANDFTIPDRVRVSNIGSLEVGLDGTIERLRSGWRLQYEAYRNEIMANRQYAIKSNAKIAINSLQTGQFGYAILTDAEKEAIHTHLEKIRGIIESSELDDRKKNSLFTALSVLTAEVNRNGTKTDRFFAFASDLGFCLAEFAEKSRPILHEIKDVLRIITKARARNENVRLPPGEEVLSLPDSDENNGN